MKTFLLISILNLLNPQTPTTAAQALSSVEAYASTISNGRQAEFPGFQEYLKTHLVYPELARKHGVEGVVRARVFIDESGKVGSVRILKKLGFGCDEAVISLLQNMPRWQPALSEGKMTQQSLDLNIRFKLN
ncbi:MAG: TonB family protein [Saprospiraceae bacterium]|nr:TonB family protein [Saprospiraceae bacterium]